MNGPCFMSVAIFIVGRLGKLLFPCVWCSPPLLTAQLSLTRRAKWSSWDPLQEARSMTPTRAVRNVTRGGGQRKFVHSIYGKILSALRLSAKQKAFLKYNELYTVLRVTRIVSLLQFPDFSTVSLTSWHCWGGQRPASETRKQGARLGLVS